MHEQAKRRFAERYQQRLQTAPPPAAGSGSGAGAYVPATPEQHADLLGKLARYRNPGETVPADAPFFESVRDNRRRAHWMYYYQRERVTNYVAGVMPEQKQLINSVDLAFDKALRRFGATHFMRNRITRVMRPTKITLSGPMVDAGQKGPHVMNTILHEMAHAATPGQHHNKTWQRFAILIGSDGKRCSEKDQDVDDAVGGRYHLVCPRDPSHPKIYKYQYSKKWETHSFPCKTCRTYYDVWDTKSVPPQLVKKSLNFPGQREQYVPR